ncbi:hypothetical protein O6H91_Y284100 [Diphasiastrum complanatum]|nr:hypothetical protein O6H91_Y284100 [Diphasiastrum complanatum]
MEAIRIKLKFENPSILTRKQMAEGVAQCWFPLRRSLHSIADLAADIISSFQLQQTCPHGISLSMEDFALLPFESISLLKEKDLLSVKERIKVDLLEPFNVKDIDTRICEDSATTNGAFYHQVGNFNLRALEEFEKESGGYRSEEEDTRLDLLAENGNGKEASKEVHGILEPHFEKRRSSKVEQRLLSSDKAMKTLSSDSFEKKAKHGQRSKGARGTSNLEEEAFVDGELKVYTPNVPKVESEPVKKSRKRKSEDAKLTSETLKKPLTVQQNEHKKVSKKKKKQTEDWEATIEENGEVEHQKKRR